MESKSNESVQYNTYNVLFTSSSSPKTPIRHQKPWPIDHIAVCRVYIYMQYTLTDTHSLHHHIRTAQIYCGNRPHTHSQCILSIHPQSMYTRSRRAERCVCSTRESRHISACASARTSNFLRYSSLRSMPIPLWAKIGAVTGCEVFRKRNNISVPC